MKSIITIYGSQFGFFREDRENWMYHRRERLSYHSSKEGEQAAEEAFELTNAPEDYLTPEQLDLLKSLKFKGPSLSVGDIVRVEPYIRQHSTPAEYYLCKSFGWEKFEGNVIELLKHLES